MQSHTRNACQAFGPNQRENCDRLVGVEKNCVSYSAGHFYTVSGMITRKYAFKVAIKDGTERKTRGGGQRKLLVISRRETAEWRTWHHGTVSISDTSGEKEKKKATCWSRSRNTINTVHRNMSLRTQT